jgi:hypothetical protein
MPINKIMSRRMKVATKPQPPVILARTGLFGRPVPVAVPPPDPEVVERRAATAEDRRAQLQERYVLHRKNHVQRLDGRHAGPPIPEFLKPKAKVRTIK